MREACGEEPLATLQQVEPIGPKRLLDLLIIAPCTGNTLAKLAAGIADTPVTLAAKSHLRNERPVLLAVSTNDGLAAAARNIGELLARRHYFFVPFSQDDPEGKPRSLVAHMEEIPACAACALGGRAAPAAAAGNALKGNKQPAWRVCMKNRKEVIRCAAWLAVCFACCVWRPARWRRPILTWISWTRCTRWARTM